MLFMKALTDFLGSCGLSYHEQERRVAISNSKINLDFSLSASESLKLLDAYKEYLLDESHASLLFTEIENTSWCISIIVAIAVPRHRLELYMTIFEYIVTFSYPRKCPVDYQKINTALRSFPRLYSNDESLKLIEKLKQLFLVGDFSSQLLSSMAWIVAEDIFVMQKAVDELKFIERGVFEGLDAFHKLGYPCSIEMRDLILMHYSKEGCKAELQHEAVIFLLHHYCGDSESTRKTFNLGKRAIQNSRSIGPNFLESILMAKPKEDYLTREIFPGLESEPSLFDLIMAFVSWRRLDLKGMQTPFIVPIFCSNQNSHLSEFLRLVHSHESHWHRALEKMIWYIFSRNAHAGTRILSYWFGIIGDAARSDLFNELLIALCQATPASPVLDLLNLLTDSNAKYHRIEYLVRNAAPLKSLFDSIHDFGEQKQFLLYRIWHRIASYSKRIEGSESLMNELYILVKKQLGSPEERIREVGIRGLSIFIESVCHQLDHDHLKEPKKYEPSCSQATRKDDEEEDDDSLDAGETALMELIEIALISCTKRFHDGASLKLLLSTLLKAAQSDSFRESREGLFKWIIGMVCGIFQENFVKEATPELLSRSKFLMDESDELIVIDLSDPCANSSSAAPVLLMFIQQMEKKLHRGHVDNIDAILGAPILLGPEMDESLFVSSCVIAYAIIREMVRAFSDQQDKDLRAKCLRRLGHLDQIRSQLKTSLRGIIAIDRTTGLIQLAQRPAIGHCSIDNETITSLISLGILNESDMTSQAASNRSGSQLIFTGPSHLDRLLPFEWPVIIGLLRDHQLSKNDLDKSSLNYLRLDELRHLIHEAQVLRNSNGGKEEPLLNQFLHHATEHLVNLKLLFLDDESEDCDDIGFLSLIDQIFEILVVNTDKNIGPLQSCLQVYPEEFFLESSDKKEQLKYPLTKHRTLLYCYAQLKVAARNADTEDLEQMKVYVQMVIDHFKSNDISNAQEKAILEECILSLFGSQSPFKILCKFFENAQISDQKYEAIFMVAQHLLLQYPMHVDLAVDCLVFFEQIVNVARSRLKPGQSTSTILDRVLVRRGRAFVDLIGSKVLPTFEEHFSSETEKILSALKTMQQGTRSLQIICNHLKAQVASTKATGAKRRNAGSASVLAQVPLLKKSLEELLLGVKQILDANQCGSAFWLGNLKHRDLDGREIASQIPIQDETESTTTDEEDEEDDEEVSEQEEKENDTLIINNGDEETLVLSSAGVI